MATVDDVAEAVARTRPDVLEAIELADATCSIFAGLQCGSLGQINLLTLKTTARTMVIELDSIDEDDPDNDFFVGEIPERVEDEVDETLGALEALIEAVEELEFCLQANAGSNTACAGEQGAKDRAVFDTEQALQTWDAYL